MPPTDPAVPSVSASATNTIIAYTKRLQGLEAVNRTSALATETLRKATAQSAKEMTRAKKSAIDLAYVIKIVGDKSKYAKAAVEDMAAEFAGGMDMMSNAQKEDFKQRQKNVQAALALAIANKNDRDATVLLEKARQMELEGAKEEIRQKIVAAKAAQNSGSAFKSMGGALAGLWQKAKLEKMDKMEMLGSAVGMTGEQMSKMSGTAIIVTLLVAGLNKMLMASATRMKDAATAGHDLGDTLGSAEAKGGAFSQRLVEMTMGFGMTHDQLLGLANVYNQEMGLSIDSSIDGSLQLSQSLAYLGMSFGVSAEESVKLGIKMGVLSRGSLKDTKTLFMNLGMQANDLNINMETLADPMMQLAEASSAAGAGVMDSVVGFNAIIDASKSLGNMGGEFNTMFSSMKNADKAGAVKSFVSNFTKIDDIQWAAFSMKKGEGFFDMMNRITSKDGGSIQAKLGMLDSLAGKLGIDKMANKTQQQFTMGMVLSKGALAGDFKAARLLGGMAEAARKNRTSFDETATTADLIDKRLNSRESVGQFIASGGDVMAKIAGTLGNLLTAATNFFNWRMGVKDPKPVAAAPSTASTPPKPYAGGNASRQSGLVTP